MTHLLRALLLLAAAVSPLGAAEAADPGTEWEARIEQDGRTLPLSGAVQVRKAPFNIVFTGPANYGYAVIAALAPGELPTALDDRSMRILVRPTNILIEKGDRSDVHLHANLPGAIAREEGSAQLWYEDAAHRDVRFQSYRREAGNRAVAVRSIAELCSGEGAAWSCQKLSTTTVERLYLVIAGVPPGRLDRFVAPRQLVLELR